MRPEHHRAWVQQAQLDAERGVIACRMCQRHAGLDETTTLWRNGQLVFALCDRCSASHDVVAVVTRPDARAGRGRGLVRSPVRERAEEHGIEVLTPTSPREPDFLDRLRAIAPDACAVVAYGALLPQTALDIPAHGWINLHFSSARAASSAARSAASRRTARTSSSATTSAACAAGSTRPRSPATMGSTSTKATRPTT